MQWLGLVLVASTLLAGAIGPASAGGAASAATGEGEDAPLDVAAMVLTMDDLAAEGWNAYEIPIYHGEPLALDGLAASLVRSEARRPAVRDALAEAGWRRGHRSRTSEYWRSDAPDLGPIVVASVSEYADAAGAARGLALEPRASDGIVGEVDAVEELGDVPPVGDASRALRLVGEDNTGDPYRVVAVWFRTGSVVAGVSVSEWADPGPSGTGVAALARRLHDRIDRVRRVGDPGLSGLATGVAAATAGLDYGFYQRRDGEEIQIGSADSPGLAARAGLAGDAVDVYRSGAFLGDVGSSRRLGYTADLYRFATPERASAWLWETPERLRRGSDATAFALDDGPSGVGDEAVAIAVTSTDEPWGARHTAAVFVRVGAVVAEVGWERIGAPVPVAVVAAAAAAQASCLRDGGPCAPVTVPRGLGEDGG